MRDPAIDIESLSAKQRLRLLDRLWDSLSGRDVRLTDQRCEELDRRLDEVDRDGPRGIPWDEVLEAGGYRER